MNPNNPNNPNNQQIVVPDDFPKDMQTILNMVRPLVTEEEFSDWVNWNEKDVTEEDKEQLRVDMYSFLREHEEYLKAKALKEQKDRNQSNFNNNPSFSPDFSNSSNNFNNLDGLTNFNSNGLNVSSAPQTNLSPNSDAQQIQQNNFNPQMSNPVSNPVNNNSQIPQANFNQQVSDRDFNSNFSPNSNIPDFTQFTNSAGSLQPNFNSAVKPVPDSTFAFVPVEQPPQPTQTISEPNLGFNSGQFNFNPANAGSNQSYVQEPTTAPVSPIQESSGQGAEVVSNMQIDNNGELVHSQQSEVKPEKELKLENQPQVLAVDNVPQISPAPLTETKKEITDQSFRSQTRPQISQPERTDRNSNRDNNQPNSANTNNANSSNPNTTRPERTDKNVNSTRKNIFNPSVGLELDELYVTMNDLEKQKLQLQSAYYEKQQGLTQRIMELESKVVNLDIFSEKLKDVSSELNSHSAIVQDVKTSIGNIGSVSLQTQINNLRDEMRKTYREISYDLESVMREFSEFRIALSKGYQKMVEQLPESNNSTTNSSIGKDNN